MERLLTKPDGILEKKNKKKKRMWYVLYAKRSSFELCEFRIAMYSCT